MTAVAYALNVFTLLHCNNIVRECYHYFISVIYLATILYISASHMCTLHTGRWTIDN